MIVRIKKRTCPYVQIDKRVLENEELSWKAKGLMAYLLSRPDDWKVMMADLVNRSPDGIEAVRSALQELSKLGYARLETARDGHIASGRSWTIYEAPGEVLSAGDEPDQEIMGSVYISEPFSAGIVKVGFSAKTEKRLTQLKARFGIRSFRSVYPASLAHERILHRALYLLRVFGLGEECYTLNEGHLLVINEAFEANKGAGGLVAFAAVLQRDIAHITPTAGNPSLGVSGVSGNPNLGKSHPTKKESQTKKEEDLFGDADGNPPAKPSKTELPGLPLSLRTPEFEAAWASWGTHRKEKRKPLTPTSAALQLNELAAMGPARAIAAITHSITKGYQGIFEPNENNSKPAPANTRASIHMRQGIYKGVGTVGYRGDVHE